MAKVSCSNTHCVRGQCVRREELLPESEPLELAARIIVTDQTDRCS